MKFLLLLLCAFCLYLVLLDDVQESRAKYHTGNIVHIKSINQDGTVLNREMFSDINYYIRLSDGRALTFRIEELESK
jgi:hypothetical protein